MIGSRWPLFRLAAAILLAPVPNATAQPPDPLDLVERLSRLGPRNRDAEGYRSGQELLIEAMGMAGLEDVGKMPPVEGWTHLTGTLAGRSETRIVLTAHYDTTSGSPGDLDNASGCAAILGAAAELSRVPRQNSMQIVLTDGEEVQASGSRAWLSEIPAAERKAILANLNVDMVGSRSRAGRGMLHIVAGWDGDRRRVSPAWLVHAALRAAEASGLELGVLDPHWSWLAQLAVRCALPSRLSDGRRFLESAVPSVTVSDLPLTASRQDHSVLDGGTVESQHLGSWIGFVAAISRRLDALEDRPAWETEYLVVAKRVWIRRDLVWVGFILWILMVWRGLPGPWRQRDTRDRLRRGRSYLPGFAFRMLFLVAVLLVPTFATLLLYPLAILAILGTSSRPVRRQVLCLLGALPTLFFVAFLAVGQIAGWLVLDRAALLPVTLIILTLATFCAWQMDRIPDRI